jgi:NAD(P)H dehydrogenase (quinone)
MSNTIFVTGASGQLGRLVIKHLLARNVASSRIIAGTRSPEKLADLAAAGIEVRAVDFEDPNGLTAAFKEVGTVLIISTDALDANNTRLKQHRNAVSSAVDAGVQRIAYTSQPNPASSLLSFAPDHLETERAIQATGLPHIVFRNGWYHENLLRLLPHALESGQWHTTSPGGRTSYVGRDNIAEAIAAALTASTSGSKTYTLTGAEALSNTDIAALASKAAGKPIAMVSVTDEDYVAGLKAAGVPDVFVSVLASIEAEISAGNLSIVTDHLEQLIARPPKPLAEYINETRMTAEVD